MLITNPFWTFFNSSGSETSHWSSWKNLCHLIWVLKLHIFMYLSVVWNVQVSIVFALWIHNTSLLLKFADLTPSGLWKCMLIYGVQRLWHPLLIYDTHIVYPQPTLGDQGMFVLCFTNYKERVGSVVLCTSVNVECKWNASSKLKISKTHQWI